MESNVQVRVEALPSHVQLIQMGTAYWVSRIVYAAAKLGLADHLAGGPKSAAELAPQTQTHETSLHRLMRALAGLGILSEEVNYRFKLTPLGEALKADAPGSARATILALAGNYWWQGWEQFDYCLETGRTGMQKTFGMSIFEYLAQRPQEAAYFNEAMVGFHGDEPPAVAAAYEFSNFQTVVDVGGGTGELFAAILQRHPGVRGVLADQAHVVAEARPLIEARRLKDRVMIESIDFFKNVPVGGDVYLLSHVIHDWTEAQCVTILVNCRKAMKSNGRLLIIETVLPAGDTPHPGKLLDIAMLVMPGGQERTEEEYRTLLNQAGFRLTRVVPTQSSVGIVEAIPL